MNRIKMTFKKMLSVRGSFFSKAVKGFLMVLAVLGLITATTISTKAYSEDSKGNLVSDNLINYQEINSNKFTDLGDNAFRLNWGGVVTTITLPYNSFKNNTQYSITITKTGGANYWEYQFFWNYTDNTSERFSNNQDVGPGTYSYTSALNKTLVSITIRLNFEATFKDLMLNEGSPMSFEPYGVTYYKNMYTSDASVMNYTNIAKGYINFNGLNNQPMQFGFIYNGRYGRYNDTTEDFEWNAFTYDTNDFIKDKINSSYGSFYHTEWNMYDMLTYYTTGYTNNDNVPLTLTYEFITPINLNNVGFDMAEFDYLSFYDSTGYLLSSVSRNDNQTLTYNNVGKIVGERHLNDIPEDTLYIASSLSSGYYDLGYKAGYNNGYNQGTQDGKENALDIGYQEGYRDGKIDGHDEGYQEALGEDITTRGFWGLLNSIMSYPVNMIKSVFNFEFMGINISALITFIVSIVIVIFIVHRFKK